VVHPAATSALPGVQRFTGNVVYPAGGMSNIGIPGNRLNNDIGLHSGQHGNGFGRHGSSFIYTVPVYVGGYGYGGYGYYDNSYLAPPAQPQQPQQPNVTVIYPPPATPVVIYPSDAQGGPAQYLPPADHGTPSVYQPPVPPQETAAAQPSSYLIAFKDHTIYSAIAYWVEGETLHYFTAGNTHNQVSVSLVDRALTERLNKDAGLEVKLPAAK
jgi:hypothetical protein